MSVAVKHTASLYRPSMLPAATRRKLSALLKRPPKLTVSQWADKYRYLSKRFAAEPGPWSTARVPYLKEPMDCFSDGSVFSITFVKSAQVGGTECMNNCVLFAMDADPGPTLYVLPTENAAKDEVAGRIKTMIDDCRQVKRHVVGTDWATLAGVRLVNMQLYMAWAAAPGTLIRRACKNVFFDELDNCQKQAGAMGNNLKLAQERTTTYGHHAKVMSVTTPTIEAAAAWQNYQDSDQRQYHVPCPLCGKYQTFRFAQIKVADAHKRKGSADLIESQHLAWYECDGCRKAIPENKRMWMVQRGVWMGQAQTIIEALPIDDKMIVSQAAIRSDRAEQWKPKMAGEPAATRRVGFHIWSAYSPWRSWSQIIAEFFRVKDFPEKLRVFINSWLGEPWVETAETVRTDSLREKCINSYPRGIVPDDMMVLVVGADVQKDRCYYVVRAWGPRRKSALVKEGVTTTLQEVYEVAIAQYPKVDGTILVPMCLAIDARYRTYEVRELAMTYPGVYACHGETSGKQPVWESDLEYAPPGKKQLERLRLYHINTDFFKTLLYRNAKVASGEIGEFCLHEETTDVYCEQFSAEHQVWQNKKRGGAIRREAIWQQKTVGAPNHYLDCEVYAAGIAFHLGAMFVEPPKPVHPRKPQLVSTAAEYLGLRR